MRVENVDTIIWRRDLWHLTFRSKGKAVEIPFMDGKLVLKGPFGIIVGTDKTGRWLDFRVSPGLVTCEFRPDRNEVVCE
ncbi:MAG: hypothetical protein JRD89_04725 [Deltaproteobacteria bacterium]|nr:hypothetical protein [Deltaproteobacteria bacterium]